MVNALKVNKTVADCEVMVSQYRAKYEVEKSEKNYRLMLWAANVLEGAKMLAKGVHKRWSMYGISQEMVKDTVFSG